VWHAPLGVRSAKRRHQFSEWTILSHSYRLIQGDIVWSQVLLDSLHPRSSRTSWWFPPVLRRGSSYDTPGICLVWHSCNMAEQRKTPCLDNSRQAGLPGCPSHLVILHVMVPFDSFVSGWWCFNIMSTKLCSHNHTTKNLQLCNKKHGTVVTANCNHSAKLQLETKLQWNLMFFGSIVLTQHIKLYCLPHWNFTIIFTLLYNFSLAFNACATALVWCWCAFITLYLCVHLLFWFFFNMSVDYKCQLW